MPKLSQAKRHRRQHNLAAFCGQDSLITPRKVSDEDIHNAGTTNTRTSLSSSCSLADWTVRAQNDDVERPSVQTRKRRKTCLVRQAPSTCLTDLLSCHVSAPELTNSDSRDNELTSILSPSVSFCGSETNSTCCKPMDESQHNGHPSDNNGAMSPIWGHFVDVILEHDEEDCRIKSITTGNTSRKASIHPSSSSATAVPSSSSRLGRQRNNCYSHSPYYSCVANRLSRKKEGRQKIVSPRALILSSSSSSQSTDQEFPDFVLQDPSALPDALARLKV